MLFNPYPAATSYPLKSGELYAVMRCFGGIIRIEPKTTLYGSKKNINYVLFDSADHDLRAFAKCEGAHWKTSRRSYQLEVNQSTRRNSDADMSGLRILPIDLRPINHCLLCITFSQDLYSKLNSLENYTILRYY